MCVCVHYSAGVLCDVRANMVGGAIVVLSNPIKFLESMLVVVFHFYPSVHTYIILSPKYFFLK